MNNMDEETEIRTERINEIRQRYLFLENKDPLEENLLVSDFVQQEGYQEEIGTFCSLLSEEHLDFTSEYHIPCWKHWKNHRIDFTVFASVRNVINEMVNRHWYLIDILSEFCHDDFMLERCPSFTYLADLFTQFKPLKKIKDIPNDAIEGVAANIGHNTLVAEVRAEGIPSPSYNWFKRKTKDEPPTPINYSFRQLYFSPFTFEDVGYYFCEITHNLEVGSDDIENPCWEPEVQSIKSAEVFVKPPDEYLEVHIKFEDRIYYHGETAKLECIITTFGQSEVQWFKLEKDQLKTIHGQTKPILNLVDLRTEDACEYYAVVHKKTSTGTKREKTSPVKVRIENGICDKIKSPVSGCCVTVEETEFGKQKINIGEELCLIFDVQCNHSNIPTEENEVEYYYEPRFVWMKTGYKSKIKNKTIIRKVVVEESRIVSTSKRLVDLIEHGDGVSEWRYQCLVTCDVEGRTIASKIFKVEVGKKVAKEKALPEFKIAMIVCQTFENDPVFDPLPGSKNDGKALAKKLKSLEFSVFLYQNLSSEGLRIAVEHFVSLIDERTYAVFYHNGHGGGIQGGDVSLLGVDNGDTKRGYHNKEIIAKITEKKPSLGLVLFDCCRVEEREHFEQPHYDIDYDLGIVEGYSVHKNQKAYALNHDTGVFIRYILKHIASKCDLDQMSVNIQKDFRDNADEIDKIAVCPNFEPYCGGFTCLANPLLSKKISRLQKKFFELTDTYHSFRATAKGSQNTTVLRFKEGKIMIELGCKFSKFHNKGTWKLMVRLKEDSSDTWTSTQQGNISVAIGIKRRNHLNMKHLPNEKTEYKMSIYINNKRARNGDFILTLCNNEIKKDLDKGLTDDDGDEDIQRPKLIQSTSRNPENKAMEENLREKQEHIAIREDHVAQREYFLAQREQNLTNVAIRESNIAIREDNIATREANIAMREAYVATREASVTQRESVFTPILTKTN